MVREKPWFRSYCCHGQWFEAVPKRNPHNIFIALVTGYNVFGCKFEMDFPNLACSLLNLMFKKISMHSLS